MSLVQRGGLYIKYLEHCIFKALTKYDQLLLVILKIEGDLCNEHRGSVVFVLL